MVTWMRAAPVIAAVAVAATLAACGSQTTAGAGGAPTARSSSPGSPGAGSSSPGAPASSSPGAPASPSRATPTGTAAMVSLRASFSPATVRLRTGQQFLVVVDPNVKADGIPWPGGCAAGAEGAVGGGLLTAQCLADGRYLYTARRPGTTTVTATVQPRCAPGSACPMWVAAARLVVVVIS